LTKKQVLETLNNMKKINWNNIIEERNQQWKQASRKEKKLIICKEVISMINAGKVRVRQGVYCNTEYSESYSGNLQKGILVGQISCTACARGTMMLAKFGFNDKWNEYKSIDSVLSNADDQDTVHALKEVFTEDELFAIETIFESNNSGVEGNAFGDVFDEREAYKYSKNFSQNPEEKLLEMMKRIIMTDGNVMKAMTCGEISKIKFPV
jgi:hypothetical protein